GPGEQDGDHPLLRGAGRASHSPHPRGSPLGRLRQEAPGGAPFRVPEDLPAEASAERDYLARVGLRSQFTIPLKMAGAVVGGIGFASFRSHLEWPEDLVLRLRLMGDIFNYSLARKHAYEALQRANKRIRLLRKELACANQQLQAAVGQALEHK